MSAALMRNARRGVAETVGEIVAAAVLGGQASAVQGSAAQVAVRGLEGQGLEGQGLEGQGLAGRGDSCPAEVTRAGTEAGGEVAADAADEVATAVREEEVVEVTSRLRIDSLGSRGCYADSTRTVTV